MKRLALFSLLLSCVLHADVAKWNGITLGGSAGNITKFGGVTIGQAGGNIAKLNGMATPSAAADPGYGGVAFAGKITSSTTEDVLTTTDSVPAGSTITLIYHNTTSAYPVTGVTDSACGAGAWTVDGSADAAGEPITLAHVVCTNGLASGQTITAAHGAGFNYKSYVVMWATNASGGLDAGNYCGPTLITDAPYTVTCAATATATKTVVFYGISSSQVYTVGGTYTPVGVVTDDGGTTLRYGYKVVSSSGSQDPGGTLAAGAYIRMVTGIFK